MKRSSDYLNSDASKRQQDVLDYVLAQEGKQNSAPVPKVSIAEARLGESHYEVISERETTRLLFISQDTSLLNQTTQSLDGYLNLSDVFDEVHIVILQTGIKARNPVLRVENNVWLYVVSAPTTLGVLSAAKKMITEQLEFAGGFRADLIVARDPLLSALVAWWASKKFNRKAQVHVLGDFTNQKMFSKFAYPKLAKFVFNLSMRRFESVRTNSDMVRESIIKKFPDILDVKTLPRFYDFTQIKESQISVDIKQNYPAFTFIILYIGKLDRGSTAYQAIDAARNLMRNPKVGLVVMGDGEDREEFQKRANILGIEKQIVFEKTYENRVSYLKTADLLLVTDIDDYSDTVATSGAAAGIPLVLADSHSRRDLFVEGESALFFASKDISGMSEQMNKLLNDIQLRAILVAGASVVIDTKLHEDPLVYKLSYRDSVEEVLFLEDDKENTK